MEPGQAIEFSLNVIHPFSVEAPLSSAEAAALEALQDPSAVIIERRMRALRYWHDVALKLAPASIEAIRSLPDPALRRLLLGVEDHVQPVLGQFCHVALYDAMLKACNSVDQTLPHFLFRASRS